MAKKVIVGGRIESKEVGGIVTGAAEILDDSKGKKQSVINQETDAELERLDGAKQNNLTFDNAPTEGSDNPVKSGGLYTAQQAILLAIAVINELIPSAASVLNQLADKAFVNSSISTNTATFRGTSAAGLTEQQFLAWANGLEHDLNDYVFWQTSDAAGNTLFKRYKWNGTEWAYEYTLNNSTFTAEQWEAIQSGITALLVTKLRALPTAQELIQSFDGKQDVLTFDDTPTLGSNNPVKSSGIYNVIKAITDLVPAEATAQNQLADKADVAEKILAAIPSWKGQYDALTDLQAVMGAKAGDMGCVKTTDSDGHAVLTFYQYSAHGAWEVYYTLRHYAQNKPATTGTTGDYPYNGMGRIELQKNIVNGVNTLTQAMLTQQNTVYVIQYDFMLGEDITVPDNCVLEFDGGSLNGAYTITGQKTDIKWAKKIFNTDVVLSGTFLPMLNPIMFGILDKPQGITDYDVLQCTHQNANRIKVPVIYDGIKEINIIAPEGGTSIKLGTYTDFCGCKISAKNDVLYNYFVFEMVNENTEQQITIPKANIDDGNLSSVSGMTDNPAIVVLHDETHWVNQRLGHNYAQDRYDVMLSLKKQLCQTPIYTYNTEQAQPTAYYKEVSLEEKVFKNLNFERPISTKPCKLIHIDENYNVTLENVSAITDDSGGYYADQLIYITNSVNVKLTNINVSGTFSTTSDNGYAIEVYNATDIHYDRITLSGKWHVFASKCLNTALITNCVASGNGNFDCHCYCKNFYFRNCKNISAQVESMFGYCKFEDCEAPEKDFTNGNFSGGVFVNTGGEYAITGFDIYIVNCNVPIKEINYFYGIYRAHYIERNDMRADVVVNELPNIFIDGIDAKNIELFNVTSIDDNTVFPNTPKIYIKNKSKAGVIHICSTTGKLIPASPMVLEISDSASTYFVNGASDNEYYDKLLGALKYKNCTISHSIAYIGYYELRNSICTFDNCLYMGLEHNRSAIQSKLRFLNCYIKFMSSSNYSYMYDTLFKDCVIKVESGSKLRDSQYTQGLGCNFINCINGNGNTEIVEGLGATGKLDFQYIAQNVFMMNSVVTFNAVTDAPTLNSKFRARGYCVAANKECFWNGSAWVDATGTPL